MSRKPPPLRIPDLHNRQAVYLGQGDDFVLLQVVDEEGTRPVLKGLVAVRPDAAEEMARSLRRRAKYAREVRA